MLNIQQLQKNNHLPVNHHKILTTRKVLKLKKIKKQRKNKHPKKHRKKTKRNFKNNTPKINYISGKNESINLVNNKKEDQKINPINILNSSSITQLKDKNENNINKKDNITISNDNFSSNNNSNILQNTPFFKIPRIIPYIFFEEETNDNINNINNIIFHDILSPMNNNIFINNDSENLNDGVSNNLNNRINIVPNNNINNIIREQINNNNSNIIRSNNSININNNNSNNNNPNNNNHFINQNSHFHFNNIIFEREFIRRRNISRKRINEIKSKLDKKTYKSSLQLDENKKQCSICLGDFKSKECFYSLPCSHIFHTRCLDKEIKYRQRCPLCRKNL